MNDASLRRWSGALLIAAMAARPAALAADDGPRPLSDAERAGVELAAAYLDGGPDAWADRLAAGSPLAALAAADVRSEIEVRAGPPEGARWELRTATAASRGRAVFAIEYASGVDETLALELVEERGGWRISGLEILGEILPPGTLRPATAAAGGGDGRGGGGSSGAPGLRAGLAGAALALAAALLLAAAARLRSAALPPGRRLAGGVPLAAALATLLAAAAVAIACGDRGRQPAEAGGTPAAAPRLELRPLLPLRRSLTRAGGTGSAGVPEPPAAASGPTATLARSWTAQYLLERGEITRAADLLGPRPAAPEGPLGELLRARLGFARRDDVETAAAFDRFAASGAAHDGHLLAAAEELDILGFEARARAHLESAAAAGSRDARIYFDLAQMEVIDSRLSSARGRFELAWRLEPPEREELLGNPIFASLLTDPEVAARLDLGSPVEPTVACPAPAGHPLRPAGAPEARLLGQRLRLDYAGAELLVPGGCDVAPEGAAVDDAAGWARLREERALARLEELTAAARAAGASADSRLMDDAGEAAAALARRCRWRELIELTAGLAADPARMPPTLVRRRAEALRREHRDRAARDLLVAHLRRSLEQGRADPVSLYQLADVLTAEGSFDTALKVIAKADSQLSYTTSGDRERRVRLERRLATDFASRRTPHFELRYGTDWDRHDVARATAVLEAELERLRRWIPVAGDDPVEVHFVTFTDYVNAVDGGMGSIGLFDGKVRVPFAEVPVTHPIVVAILAHELAHAMISQATGDRAPRWLQEGLAQHVQMVQGRINPIPGYVRMSRRIAFPLLDVALAGMSLPEIQEVAYDEANWILHFIEREHGVEGIHRLLAAFREGATTDEALARLFGLSPAGFDRAFERWATARAPGVWPVEMVRYDAEDRAAAAAARAEAEVEAEERRRAGYADEEPGEDGDRDDEEEDPGTPDDDGG